VGGWGLGEKSNSKSNRRSLDSLRCASVARDDSGFWGLGGLHGFLVEGGEERGQGGAGDIAHDGDLAPVAGAEVVAFVGDAEADAKTLPGETARGQWERGDDGRGGVFGCEQFESESAQFCAARAA
jgi:hypothetical protein